MLEYCHVYYILLNQGAAIDRILAEIVHSKSMTTPIDYVLCIGHFLAKVSFSSLYYSSGIDLIFFCYDGP